MLQLETAGLSDIGKKRDNQEDAYLVDDKHRLYVVADGMGTTISVLYFTDNRVVLANVGDSPVYLVRAGNIDLISAMHTVVADPELRDVYGPNPLLGQFNHMLTRAVGTADTVEPYIQELMCPAGDTYIICSDGLSNAVQPEEMISISLGKSAENACREFIDLANTRGGDDNTTVIVINVNEGSPERK